MKYKKRLIQFSNKIKPIVQNCERCGKKVENHHFFCDKCWGFRAKRLNDKRFEKILGYRVYKFTIKTNNMEGFVNLLDNLIENSKKYKFEIECQQSLNNLLNQLNGFESHIKNEK